jgi:hypothetical protein
VPAEGEAKLLAELERNGAPARAVIGEVVEGNAGHVDVVGRPTA